MSVSGCCSKWVSSSVLSPSICSLSSPMIPTAAFVVAAKRVGYRWGCLELSFTQRCTDRLGTSVEVALPAATFEGCLDLRPCQGPALCRCRGPFQDSQRISMSQVAEGF